MFSPKNYGKYSKIQTTNNLAMLKKYEDIAYWKNSKCESVIDLGSGDGSFTSNELTKFLPDNCKKIIGSDKFEDMVQHATENYKTDRISFTVLDAEGTLPEEYYESFDHVFSFHALQLVRGQKKAFENIYQLLHPGGSCFILMIAKTKMYETYITLQKEPKWKKWLTNVDYFISTYADCLDPAKTVTKIMMEVGFSNIRVEVEKIINEFENIQEFKDFVTSINITTVPEELSEEFVNDYVDVARANGMLDNNLRMKFENIIAFGSKNDDKNYSV